MINEYASWSIALQSMVKNPEAFNDYEIGKANNGNSLKFSDWLKIPNNYFTSKEALTDDFKKTFKNVDLGGGDQKKIKNGEGFIVKIDDSGIDRKFNSIKKKENLDLIIMGDSRAERQIIPKTLSNRFESIEIKNIACGG